MRKTTIRARNNSFVKWCLERANAAAESVDNSTKYGIAAKNAASMVEFAAEYGNVDSAALSSCITAANAAAAKAINPKDASAKAFYEEKAAQDQWWEKVKMTRKH